MIYTSGFVIFAEVPPVLLILPGHMAILSQRYEDSGRQELQELQRTMSLGRGRRGSGGESARAWDTRGTFGRYWRLIDQVDFKSTLCKLIPYPRSNHHQRRKQGGAGHTTTQPTHRASHALGPVSFPQKGAETATRGRENERRTVKMAGQDEKPAQPVAQTNAAKGAQTTGNTSTVVPPAPGVRPPGARPQATQPPNTGRPPMPNPARPPAPRPAGQAARPPMAPGATPRPGGQGMQPRPGMARPVQPHAQGRPPQPPTNGQRPTMQQARPGPLQGPNGGPGRPLNINTAAAAQQGIRPAGIRPGQGSVPGSTTSSAPASAPNSAPGTPRSSIGSNASGPGQATQPQLRRPPGSIPIRPQSGQLTPSLTAAGGGFAVGGGLATPTTQGECEAWAARLRDTSIGELLRFGVRDGS